MPFLRGLLPLTAMIACLLGMSCAASAGQNVKVCLVTILASQHDNKVDDLVKSIAAEVQKKKPRLKLKGFQVANMTCKSLATGQKWTVKLVDGQTAEVVIDQPADKDNWVVLRVTAPRQGEIQYGTVCGKYLPIVTRYKTKDKGDRLILAIMVKPCHKGKPEEKK
jgi:hypothetical protein